MVPHTYFGSDTLIGERETKREKQNSRDQGLHYCGNPNWTEEAVKTVY